MKNLDRIRVLKKFKSDMNLSNIHICTSDFENIDVNYIKHLEESLNWAIKICEKYESKRLSSKI